MADSSTESKSITPQSQITEENVKKALVADKGEDVSFKSWKVVDFTKRGDNYACVVTSVEVQYVKNNQEHNVTYVVKLNPCRDFPGMPDMSDVMFRKEGKFYEEILPELNAQLISANQKPLNLPKCLMVCLEEGKEQIYFEDLRAQDFKMFDRRKGMSNDHSLLVLKELARMHAASYLFKNKYPEDTWYTRYDYLSKDFLNFKEDTKDVMLSMLQSAVTQGKEILGKVGGYEMAIKWLDGMTPELEHIFTDYMQSDRFNSICHGDCWNNNILFRYDDTGRPVEVMLLDLQVCRKASLATDLNYFLYTSLTGEVRKPNLDNFMSVYHSSYKTVVESGGQSMYFTEDELMAEFRAKNKLGLFFATNTIPALLMEPDEIPDFSSGTIDIEKIMQEYKESALSQLGTNPMMKPRFLAVYDELIETGLIC